MCVCSLSYPAFKGHAPPHIFICGLSGSIIIFQIISSTLRFFREKNVIEYTRRVFWFFLQLLLETFLILRTTQRDTVTHTHTSSCKHPLFSSNFNKTWIFSTYFRKSWNIKLHENPPNGRGVVPCRRTDMRKLFEILRKSVNKQYFR